jgi:hypothetical protein
MQVNLFYHLMMKSTINRPIRNDDLLPAPVSAPAVSDPIKGVLVPYMDYPNNQEWSAGDHAGIINGAGNMKIDGTR